MPQEVRIWEIGANDRLDQIKRDRLDLELRIQKWLEQDIALVADDLLVIGREVTTGFGGAIDLLCLDANGDAVIVELKRDKTPRDITAQVLDYASWVSGLSAEQVAGIAAEQLGVPLEEAFRRKFGDDLPETLNGQHKMLIVASVLDPATERIITYLSDTHGVNINAVQFQYFRGDGGKEYLARVFLIEPSQVDISTGKGGSKRRPNLTFDQLQALATEKGIGPLYEKLTGGLWDYFDSHSTTLSTAAFIGNIEDKRRTIFSLSPTRSNAEQGVKFYAYIDRFATYLGTTREQLIAILPPESKETLAYEGGEPQVVGFFRDAAQVSAFLDGLGRLRQ